MSDPRLCPIDSRLELTISNLIAFHCNRAEKFATVTFMAKNQLLFGRLCEVGLPNSYDRFRTNANFLHFFLILIATEFKNFNLRLHGEKSIYISGACVKLDPRLCPIDCGLMLIICIFIATLCNRDEKNATVAFMTKNQLLIGRLCEVRLPTLSDRFRTNVNNLQHYCNSLQSRWKVCNSHHHGEKSIINRAPVWSWPPEFV